jgi:hypothetical protein
MIKKCVFELDVAPRCHDMDLSTFRAFVIDQCVPSMWEAMGKIKPTYALVDGVLDETMRGGSGEISCKADSSGAWECGASARWSF